MFLLVSIDLTFTALAVLTRFIETSEKMSQSVLTLFFWLNSNSVFGTRHKSVRSWFLRIHRLMYPSKLITLGVYQSNQRYWPVYSLSNHDIIYYIPHPGYTRCVSRWNIKYSSWCLIDLWKAIWSLTRNKIFQIFHKNWSFVEIGTSLNYEQVVFANTGHHGFKWRSNIASSLTFSTERLCRKLIQMRHTSLLELINVRW